LIAYRVAEDRRVFLPLAISADGAFLTHSQALTMVPPKEKVDRFLPRYNRGDLLLHPDNPITVAPQANEDWVIEIRRQNNEAMKRAYTVIEEAYADFRRVFGRGPENPWFEEYMTDDAEIILVGMGTISLPIKVAIREMRCPRRRRSGSSTATTPSARRSGRAWSPTRSAPPCTTPSAGRPCSRSFAGWAVARSRSRTSTRRRTCATVPRSPANRTRRRTGSAFANRRARPWLRRPRSPTLPRSSSRSVA